MASGEVPDGDIVLFVVNPVSAGGKGKKVFERRILPKVRGLANVRYLYTEGPGHAIEVARGFRGRRIVAVGGDGTLNEVANGILLSGSGVEISQIPVGTGNDFARTLEIPKRTEEALKVALCGRVVKADVIRLKMGPKERYAVNIAGVGFDAMVARDVSALKGRRPGALPYLVALFKNLVKFAPQRVRFEIEGATYEEGVSVFAIANGRYFGGGMKISPSSSPHDGILEVVRVGPVGRGELIAKLWLVYSGRHVGDPKVAVWRARRGAVLTGGLPVEADGESVGETPLCFEVVRLALKVVVP